MDEGLQKKVAACVDAAEGADVALANALASVEAAVLVELAGHAVAAVRAAVAKALQGREEPALLELAATLAVDEYQDVRVALARVIADAPQWPLPDGAVRRLLDDDHDEVRKGAARAASRRPSMEPLAAERLLDDDDWEVRDVLAQGLGEAGGFAAFAALLTALAHDDDWDVKRSAARSADKRLGALEEELAAAGDEDLPPATLASAAGLIDQVGRRRAPALAAWLEERTKHAVDLDKLRRIGTDLTGQAVRGALPRAHRVDGPVATLHGILTATEGPRSAVLVGASGCGKTAVVHELVHRLQGEGWHVLRVSPSELLAGTVYLGEWQTKVRELVRACGRPKRVVVYVPGAHELSEAGRASSSDLSIGTMLAPAVEAGDIALLGEASSEAWLQGTRRDRTLRRLFQSVELQPVGGPATRAILTRVADELGADLDAEAIERLIELGDLYLPDVAQPGRAVGLLRRVVEKHGSAPDARAMLATLHDSTGVPIDFLDDAVPLDLDATRAFFEARVMGQPDAVERVLELVTLAKAGLADPDRPNGVLLFVGPTGVGKTELARALAELLFGDAARLKRFDMSEYATYEAFERLIGAQGGAGLLTDAVREQPFGLILLDEIEKAHTNVFDLCLQMFDAGRLTDGLGRTADLRNTIVILTSNVGAAVQIEAQVGFAGTAPPPPDPDAVQRELRRAFRPEFLNRVDHVVHFRPLALETADRIARREVARVVERSGITRRELLVDVDPSVVSLLLAEGYSPAYGARPLKRTVERRVLLPIARRIATGAVVPGSVLQVFARDGRVVVEVLEPEIHEDEPAEVEARHFDEVRARVDALSESAAPLEDRKAALLERSNAVDFWSDRPTALAVLDEVHRLDRVLDDLRRLEDDVERTAANPDPRRAAAFVARHERAATCLELAFTAPHLDDAWVRIESVRGRSGGLGAVERQARAYRAFARRHRFECTVVDDRAGGEPLVDAVVLHVAGASAHALLAGEAGVHRWMRTDAADGRKRVRRELVRVEVLRAPPQAEPLPPADVQVEARELAGARGRLGEAPNVEVTLLHRPSRTSLVTWSHAPREQAVHTAQLLLRAQLDVPPAAGSPQVVRSYRLGPAPLVSDRRCGVTSGRLDRVLEGELEPFLAAK